MTLNKAIRRKYRFKSPNKSYYGSHLLKLLTTFGVKAAQRHYTDKEIDKALRAVQQEFEKRLYGEEWGE